VIDCIEGGYRWLLGYLLLPEREADYPVLNLADV
jgi:hypothetical protein